MASMLFSGHITAFLDSSPIHFFFFREEFCRIAPATSPGMCV
jgi:hypothetical protein